LPMSMLGFKTSMLRRSLNNSKQDCHLFSKLPQQKSFQIIKRALDHCMRQLCLKCPGGPVLAN
jgi:hypothetical protein